MNIFHEKQLQAFIILLLLVCANLCLSYLFYLVMKRRVIENNSQHLCFRFFENYFVKNHLYQIFLLNFLHIFSQKMWHFHKKFDIIFTMFIVFHNIVKSIIWEIFA